MITHIIFLKLKDSASNAEKIKALLLDMEGKVPQLRHVEVGLNVQGSERAYDLALVTKFDSLDDLEAYKIHPVHVEVGKQIALVKEAAASVDYES